jgi:CRP-like cAMP-binding protein
MLALTGSAPAMAAKSAGFISGLSPSVLPDAVWPKGIALMVARDAPLYQEGDAAKNWYRLVSGTMRVFRVLRDGRRHISDLVFPGQFFGFEPGATHHQGAEAVEPASVLAYSCERIEQRNAQDPVARQAIRELLMERLAAAQERIMLLGRLNATGRLAAFLLTMAQRTSKAGPFGRAGAHVADLPMSRVDIADYLGLTVETVSRLFTALRCRGAIRLPTANRVEIVDADALERACGGAVDGAHAQGEGELAHCA